MGLPSHPGHRANAGPRLPLPPIGVLPVFFSKHFFFRFGGKEVSGLCFFHSPSLLLLLVPSYLTNYINLVRWCAVAVAVDVEWNGVRVSEVKATGSKTKRET